MILYTTVPYEQVYPTDAADFSGQMMVEHQGVPVLVQKVEDKYRVIRVMSSDPAHYMNSSICPGEFITN
ncbi:ribonuclease [[Bacillus] enclensis]|uniref:YlzJ-like protein n=2 Tax=Rossellomorea TaxID=2837508 RepID=A0A0V8HIR3_9BACI|nr:YlzJ-like family protein [[Bacillus] enclensis]OAT82787.1 ribonuclease [Bacillus sp. MKU004]QTC42460.1 YlzJ-like family protein [Bacillus sp. V3]QWC24529.1 YlzJ-like family protein [Bacillus haikouensis]KSU62569.1 ribonuclease [[Bacillus] enclensis]MBH9965423.1 YlzJ-like family protein [[Bacillus] enclensis]